MPNNRDFSKLELVRREGEIYAIDRIYGRKGQIGVTAEAEPQDEDNWDCEIYSPALWFPLRQIEKLQPIQADAATVRSFFRLDKSPWELARSGAYPFAGESAKLVPTTDDILAATAKLPHTEYVTFQLWRHLFFNEDCFINTLPMDEIPRLLYALLKASVEDTWDYLNGSQEKQTALQVIVENAARPLSDWVVEAWKTRIFFQTVEEMAQEQPLSRELGDLYVRILDDDTNRDEDWRVDYRAYAYYGGNSVVACDWPKSEQALLKAYELHSESFEKLLYANSLGYIYYSQRLGAPDYAKAFRYFSEASEGGIIEASYKLADLYRQGHGTQVDGAKALALLKPLYEMVLCHHQDGDYNNKLADIALRMGYCARDGVGREKNLGEAYRYFRQAENAIRIRLAKFNNYGDSSVQTSIKRALEELLQVYSPDSENYAGWVGKVPGHQALARCLQDDGETILISFLEACPAEQRVPKKSFTPLTENIRNVGEQVTLCRGSKPAVIKAIDWHNNRETPIYTLTADGKELRRWYFESDFADAKWCPEEVYAEGDPLYFLGNLVRHAGQIYAVVGEGFLYLERQFQVVPVECLRICPADPNDGEDIKAQLVPMNEAEDLPPVPVDPATVKAFFCLETTVWELLQEGKFPIAAESSLVVPSAAELVNAVGRLLNADRLTFSQWCKAFVSPGNFIPLQQVDEQTRLMLSMLADHYSYMPDLSKLYKQFENNANRPLRDWAIDDFTNVNLLLTAEELAGERPISEDLRCLYTRVLDRASGRDEKNLAYHRGLTYYRGNKVISSDWVKAEQALLTAYALNTFDEKSEPANALGHIYYSGRLGTPDYAKAFRYFGEAAAAGNTESRYKLSDMHRLGYGTPRDGKKALELLKPLYCKALKRYKHKHYDCKLADLALRLGYCARDGVGREKDADEAYRYFRQAKEAITLRRENNEQHGDDAVEANINRALEGM